MLVVYNYIYVFIKVDILYKRNITKSALYNYIGKLPLFHKCATLEEVNQLNLSYHDYNKLTIHHQTKI